jgi:uncharacterized integral membrane protein
MPFRLIWYIIVLIFIFIFIGLNLGNTSDINLWFSESARLTDVPIFISFFVMYIFGALSVIPFVIGSGLKKQKKMKQQQKLEQLSAVDTASSPEKKKKLIKRKAAKNAAGSASGTDSSESDGKEIL